MSSREKKYILKIKQPTTNMQSGQWDSCCSDMRITVKNKVFDGYCRE